MEKVNIWYVTDSEDGKKMAGIIEALGLAVDVLSEKEYRFREFPDDSIVIIIIDYANKELDNILSIVGDENKSFNHLKFVVLKKRQIRAAIKSAMNLLHVEFISRPVVKREFVLLLEKTILVERYRELMKIFSKEAEGRIEAFESLMNIQRKDFFQTEKQKRAFENILEYEKHLREEQTKLNKHMKEFALIRHRELFDMKNRIQAEEMLADLRRKELLDAKNIIQAQEQVINFSTRELDEANKIIDASERAAELGRLEAIELHKMLKDEREKNVALAGEIDRLNKELKRLAPGCK